MEGALAGVHVDLHAPDVPGAVRALLTHPHGGPWAGAVAPADVTVAALSGGITNRLFRCAAPARLGRAPLLVRVFGAQTELFIDRAADNATVALLAASGVGVPCVAVFGNGRVEGLLDARPLEPAEMAHPALARAIAVEAAHLHALPPAGLPGDARQPVLWPFLDRCFAAACAVTFDAATEAAHAAALAALDLPRVGRALAWLRAHTPSDANGLGAQLLGARAQQLAGGGSGGGADATAIASPPTHSAVAGFVGDLHVPAAPRGCADAPLAQARLDAAALACSVVFAHNDLLAGNVLVSDGDGDGAGDGGRACSGAEQPGGAAPRVPHGRVQLIDYEYAGFNFVGYELANHFCEHAGFEYELARYPSARAQAAWCRAYLAARGLRVPTRATYAHAPVAVEAAAAAAGAAAAGANGRSGDDGGDGGDDVSAAFLDELGVWVNRSAPLSDAWWGVWAVLQARNSPLAFDFMGFAGRRLAALHAHVGKFWPAVEGGLGAPYDLDREPSQR